MIETHILPIQEALPYIEILLEDKFHNTDPSKSLGRYFNQLKPSLWVFVEFPYVDSLYRDAYYHFFSSKHFDYNRNAIRVSFFEEEIEASDFRNTDRFEYLQSLFCGFLVIRPIRRPIGRNILSPRATIKTGLHIRTTKTTATINGVKLEIEGFPHSSQDVEVMSCAETTVWSLMEYFGTKYSEYNTTLPSKIRNILNQIATERQLPSSGLLVTSISYLIKSFGLGSRKYVRATFDQKLEDYYQSLYCYIESGIPVVLCIINENIGHATLCIGRQTLSPNEIEKIKPSQIGTYQIFDLNTVKRKLVIIDDNHPPYQLSCPENPTVYYNSTYWQDSKIEYYIAPLHNRIYLEPVEAKKVLFGILEYASNFIELPKNKTYVRLFLTSSKSLKSNAGLNKKMLEGLKNLIIGMTLPKFVWVAELSSEEALIDNCADGIILFDATESDTKSLKSLFFAAFNNKMLIKYSMEFKVIDLPLPPFSAFSDNLNIF